MKQDITNYDIYKLIDDFRKEVRELYVTKGEFDPVRNLVYSMVGVILLTVVGALLMLVIKK